MNEGKNTSLKKTKILDINNETHKETKHLNIKEEQINIKTLQKIINNQYDKNANPLFINNKNHIESIDIINNNNKNYKNIILNNMLTPNKKFFLKEKISSKNKRNIKIERNILYDNGHAKKNFRTLGQNKQKSLNKNSALKLLLNNQEQDNNNDMEMKYKLILYEKNNLINKLKSEVEYYKNYYHNINMNMNIILPNNNTNTIEANRNNAISIGINDKKNIEGNENIRSRIKTIFSLPKKEIKFDNNHLLQHNMNDYNTIKTFVSKVKSDNINYNNAETTKDFVPQIKNDNFNTIENNSSNLNKYNNKLLLSNDSLKNDLKINKNSIENHNINTLNNIFYRSNSNTIQKKGRKLKLGLQQNELTLDMNNNYNSIEANRNYLKNKKNIIYSLNFLSSKNSSDNELNNNKRTIDDISNNRFEKRKHYFNNISSSPSSLYNDLGNKNIIIDDNNSKNSIAKNDNCEKFNYRDNFENLKKRMNNLIINLFYLIEVKNKTNQQENQNNNK